MVIRTIKDALDFSDLPGIEVIIFTLFALFLALFPWIPHSAFSMAVMIQFLLFSLYGMGWNTIGGYGGQIALGKAQYVGISAYTVAMFMVWWDIPPWFSAPVGMILAVSWSFIIGYPLFRLRGHYFAIATIAASLVLQGLFTSWPLVHGARGVSLPFKRTPNFLYLQFTNDTYYYYLIFLLFILTLLYMNWFRKSKLGYQLRAVKASEEAAESLGIDARWAKVKAYAIASAVVAMGGAFYAVYVMYIDPSSVMDLNLSIMIALMAMLGGSASLWGPIIGAAILVPLDRYLGSWLGGSSGFLGVDFMIYALIIMVVAAVEPKGVWGMVERVRRSRHGTA